MTDLVDLHTLIKASYEDKNKQEDTLKRFGYDYDKELSNDTNQVYYNPQNNKLIHSVRGIASLSDVGTDAYLAVGKLKSTNRYKDSLNVYNKAKKKYNNSQSTLVGHSLGGGIVSELPSDNINDKVISYNKGSSLFHPAKANETSYRINSDLVSIANVNSSKTKTLRQKNRSLNPQFFNSGANYLYNSLLSHKPINIKDQKIFV